MNMNRQSRLSLVAQKYLEEYRCILDRMIKGMTEAELNNSVSHNFIVQMLPHHKAAIEMSQNLLQYTTNIPLQNIAMNIISEQTKSIENMENALAPCSQICNTNRELCAYEQKMKQIMGTMFKRMTAAPEFNDINCSFMAEMIPHHEGAVQMSETTLKYNICLQLKPILSAIIKSQKKGIVQMKSLYRCIGCNLN